MCLLLGVFAPHRSQKRFSQNLGGGGAKACIAGEEKDITFGRDNRFSLFYHCSALFAPHLPLPAPNDPLSRRQTASQMPGNETSTTTAGASGPNEASTVIAMIR